MDQPSPAPLTPAFWRNTLIVGVSCLLALTHLVWSMVRPGDHPLFLAALCLGMALFLSTRGLWRTSTQANSSRLGLTHVSLAAVFLAVSLRAWNASELVSRLSELCQVIFATTAILALLRLPRQKASRLEQLRSSLDVLIIVAANWVYAWHFLIERLLARPFDAWAALCLVRATLHPALVAVLVSSAFRAAVSRPAWPGIGLIAFVGADVFSIMNEVGIVMPAFTESLWSWGAVCLIVSSLQDQAKQALEPEAINPSSTLELRAKLHDLARPLRQPRWVRALQLGGPFVTVALVYALHLLEPESMNGALAEGSLMVIVGLVLMRQTLAILESRRLSRELRDLNHAFDGRVEERTLALEESRLRLIASRRLDRDRNEVLELIARDEPVTAIRERLDRINNLEHYGFASQELLETTDRLNEIAEQRRE
jgi:hypothetical protein